MSLDGVGVQIVRLALLHGDGILRALAQARSEPVTVDLAY
jgi:hypothetical protein